LQNRMPQSTKLCTETNKKCKSPRRRRDLTSTNDVTFRRAALSLFSDENTF